jgi:hypothetical protein
MVKPNFLNLDAELWLYPRRLGRLPLSLCLYHSAKQIGLPILEALAELQSEGSSSKRKLTFKATPRAGCITTLRLLLVPDHEDLHVLNVASESESATIQMTDIGLPLVRDAVRSWLEGGEDFGVSAQHSGLRPDQLGTLDRTSGELWFWGPNYVSP